MAMPGVCDDTARCCMQKGGSAEGDGAVAQDAAEAAGFVLEIGTEEMPPAELTAVLEQLKSKAAAMLTECRLSHEGVEVLGTPRRLVACVRALAPRQETVTEERRGPPRSRAYDSDGSPTKALLGFCRGCGVDAEGVFFKEDKKVRSVAHIVPIGGPQPISSRCADCSHAPVMPERELQHARERGLRCPGCLFCRMLCCAGTTVVHATLPCKRIVTSK